MAHWLIPLVAGTVSILSGLAAANQASLPVLSPLPSAGHKTQSETDTDVLPGPGGGGAASLTRGNTRGSHSPFPFLLALNAHTTSRAVAAMLRPWGDKPTV